MPRKKDPKNSMTKLAEEKSSKNDGTRKVEHGKISIPAGGGIRISVNDLLDANKSSKMTDSSVKQELTISEGAGIMQRFRTFTYRGEVRRMANF